MMSHVIMQLIATDQLGKISNTSRSRRHLEFATNRSTAIQHGGNMVEHARSAFAVCDAGLDA
jgi:hypothetical protein